MKSHRARPQDLQQGLTADSTAAHRRHCRISSVFSPFWISVERLSRSELMNFFLLPRR